MEINWTAIAIAYVVIGLPILLIVLQGISTNVEEYE